MLINIKYVYLSLFKLVNSKGKRWWEKMFLPSTLSNGRSTDSVQRSSMVFVHTWTGNLWSTYKQNIHTKLKFPERSYIQLHIILLQTLGSSGMWRRTEKCLWDISTRLSNLEGNVVRKIAQTGLLIIAKNYILFSILWSVGNSIYIKFNVFFTLNR